MNDTPDPAIGFLFARPGPVQAPGPVTDGASGVGYQPWTDGRAAGLQVWHPSGRTELLYLNPSLGSDDGVPNVVLYRGSAGDPATDEPQHHYDLTPRPIPGKLCGCPADATTTVSGVLVTGHQDGCPSAGPRQYVWQRDGHLVMGSLADYGVAFAVEHDASLLGTGLGEELRTWEASYAPRAEGLGGRPDREGYWPIRLSVPGESVEVKVRAI